MLFRPYTQASTVQNKFVSVDWGENRAFLFFPAALKQKQQKTKKGENKNV